MAQAATLNARRTAVIHGDRRLTFEEAWRRGIQLANALLALELHPGGYSKTTASRRRTFSQVQRLLD
jgi:non-ribosomal peptide synthetase component E (peptide arylation enzyme)